MSLNLKGVVFDLDGTLANTLPVCYAAFRRAFADHTGQVYTDAEIVTHFGPNEEGAFRKAAPDCWEACLQTFLAEYAAAHTLCPEPFPGILELLDWLKQEGVAVAVVTGKGAESAAISLHTTGLLSRIPLIETGFVTGPNKPLAIQKVLASWNLAPEQAVYVGDVPSDITAARTAGVLPLAAAWAPTADYESLNRMEPAAIFRTIAEFRDWLQNHLP